MKRILTLLAFSLLFFSGNLQKASAQADTLTVGLNSEPPFIMKAQGSQREGVSVYLWEEVAKSLNQPYRYKSFDLKGLQEALEAGDIDMAITPMTVTSDRLKRYNMTQPFFISNLTVATQKKEQSQALLFLANFVSIDFLKAVLLLFIILLVFGVLLWLAEKRSNPEMFDKGFKGLWDGIWWSAVTMTTVGYGDKAPKSNTGKIIAIVWMFTAVIVISAFTASIASSLTVNTLQSDIEQVEDLKRVSLGTVNGSIGASFINEKGWNYKGFQDVEEALQALKNRKIDALVYDAPILNYLVKDNNLKGKIEVLPFQLKKQYYSFSVPKDSRLHETLNPLMLDEIKSPGWQSVLEKYNLK